MWEIELERCSEGHYGPGDKAAKNRWEESIRILAAAKAQLLRGSGLHASLAKDID
jgi:hypothetical protein